MFEQQPTRPCSLQARLSFVKLLRVLTMILTFLVMSGAIHGNDEPLPQAKFTVAGEIIAVSNFYSAFDVALKYRPFKVFEFGVAYDDSKIQDYQNLPFPVVETDAYRYNFHDNSIRAFANVYPTSLPLYAQVGYGKLSSYTDGGLTVRYDPFRSYNSDFFLGVYRIDYDQTRYASLGAGVNFQIRRLAGLKRWIRPRGKTEESYRPIHNTLSSVFAANSIRLLFRKESGTQPSFTTSLRSCVGRLSTVLNIL